MDWSDGVPVSQRRAAPLDDVVNVVIGVFESDDASHEGMYETILNALKEANVQEDNVLLEVKSDVNAPTIETTNIGKPADVAFVYASVVREAPGFSGDRQVPSAVCNSIAEIIESRLKAQTDLSISFVKVNT
ncbi:hypothetical protein [Salinigranum halophilum]|uniref:hypothetical protein n=1 Tax=Salinigranum halophilum TaxID=2565931 RepID=UPI00115C5E1F|nr:hypothetical protein [Salinigranum halophilum]